MSERRPSMPLIYAITVTGITVNTLIAPGIPDILRAFDAPEALAGLVLAGATLPGIVIAPAAGILADRFGRREVLVPCLVIYGVAGGLGALAPSLWVLVALRFVQGAGSAGLINLGVVLIGDQWEAEERARRIGRNAAVLTIGVAILPSVGGGLIDLGGWRTPFFIYPVALLTAVFVARRLPRTQRRDGRLRDQIAEVTPYLRSPTMIGVVGTGVVLFILIFGLLLTVMPIYIEDRFGLSAGGRGLIMGLPAVGAMVMALSLGRLVPIFGRARLIVTATTLMALCLLAFAWAPALWILALAVLVFGLGEGLIIPSLQDTAASFGPGESRGTVVAVWVGGARLGQTIGPILAGLSLGMLGAAWSFVAGSVLAGALTVGLVVGLRIRRDRSPMRSVDPVGPP